MNRTFLQSGVGITAALGAFVERSLAEIAVWLLVIFFIIMTDLLMGIYKCYKKNVNIRISKGIRDTMGKISAYFSFVVVAVFCEIVFEYPPLGKIACGFIIGGESISIAGNYCKAHGYTLHVNKLFDFLGGKAKGIITKDEG